MNKSFIQINDNYATVSDENGNIRLVSKKNNKTSFEEILTKENELEEKENSLKEAKEDLSINKNNIIGGEILNLTLYGGTAFLYFFMNGKVAPVGTATITALYYGTLKVVACAMSGGTRIRKIKDRKYLVLINKIDLENKLDRNKINIDSNKIVELSITEDRGIEELKEKIVEMFNLNEIETKDPTYLSNSRSISILKRCLKRVEDIEESLKNNMPIDMIELDIKNIWEELGTINGSTYEEELLDEMFKRFCLGK